MYFSPREHILEYQIEGIEVIEIVVRIRYTQSWMIVECSYIVYFSKSFIFISLDIFRYA